MVVPDANDKIWHEVLLGDNQFNFDFLALQFLLMRLRLKVKSSSNNTDVISQCANELSDFFQKTNHIPKCKADLEKIIGLVAV